MSQETRYKSTELLLLASSGGKLSVGWAETPSEAKGLHNLIQGHRDDRDGNTSPTCLLQHPEVFLSSFRGLDSGEARLQNQPVMKESWSLLKPFFQAPGLKERQAWGFLREQSQLWLPLLRFWWLLKLHLKGIRRSPNKITGGSYALDRTAAPRTQWMQGS